MKIYNEVKIRMGDWEVVEEDSFEYVGPIAECGGSGGGSGSGTVIYDGYNATFHREMLDSTTAGGDHDLDESVTSMFNDAITVNPFTSETAFDPDESIGDMIAAVLEYASMVDEVNPENDWETEVVAVDTLIDSTIVTAPMQSTPSPNAASDISTDFIDPTLNADTDIGTAFIDPSPNADTDIDDDFEDPYIAVEGEIQDAVDAFEAIVDDHVSTDILPRFQAGMYDINAVQSSAFTLGQAVIEAQADREVAQYQGEIRTKAFMQGDALNAESTKQKNQLVAEAHLQNDRINAESIGRENELVGKAHLQIDLVNAESVGRENELIGRAYLQDDALLAVNIEGKNAINSRMEEVRRGMIVKSTDTILSNGLQKIQFLKDVMHYTMESSRLNIVAKKEEKDQQLSIDEDDARWDLEMFEYVNHTLAAIAGGVSGTHARKPSVAQSAIGGALSGAAAGAMVGGPWGAAIGGVGGALMSLFG